MNIFAGAELRSFEGGLVEKDCLASDRSIALRFAASLFSSSPRHLSPPVSASPCRRSTEPVSAGWAACRHASSSAPPGSGRHPVAGGGGSNEGGGELARSRLDSFLASEGGRG